MFLRGLFSGACVSSTFSSGVLAASVLVPALLVPALLIPAVLGHAAIAEAKSSLPRSTPEAEGVDSAGVQKFVEALEARVDAVHSVMLVRHGKVVAEGWWGPYQAADPHVMYSVTKSFTSTAVGFAAQE